ncbi:MAG: YbgC/YbaW family acyl-CoA thioester hydrolase [Mariniblastus sp.]|jgi:YbgC/YbaW family acyl-CoA thioester hydrolase
MARVVRQADTDASGFAHFSSYVRMMEETEYAFLRSRGLCVVLYDERGTMGFPRLNVSIVVHEPLVFDDSVEVRLRMVEIDGKQITYAFELVQANQAIAVEGQFRVACCRFPGRDSPYAILIPEFIEEALMGISK